MKNWFMVAAGWFALVACENPEVVRPFSTLNPSQAQPDAGTPWSPPTLTLDAGDVRAEDAGTDASDGGPPREGCLPELKGTLRDFLQANLPKSMIPTGYRVHPDFQQPNGTEKGIVASELGSDGKPVYDVPSGATTTTSGKKNFDQWYRDTPGVNKSVPITLLLDKGSDGVYKYHDLEFFPLDDDLRGFGISWNGDIKAPAEHDYHFTLELGTNFTYHGGETFHFEGDDDVWVFINGKLAIDLGGVHTAQTDLIRLDERAEELGIEIGKEYPLHFFSAERRLFHSTIRIETTLVVCADDPPDVPSQVPVVR